VRINGAEGIIKDVGKAQEKNKVACLILDHDSVVPWVLAPSFEHTLETVRLAQGFGGRSLDTWEAETQVIAAPTFAVAANVKEEARHVVYAVGRKTT
jgi:hypothetical protein